MTLSELGEDCGRSMSVEDIASIGHNRSTSMENGVTMELAVA